MINSTLLTDTREYLLAKGTLTISYLLYSIKQLKSHQFLDEEERKEMKAVYDQLLEELK